MPPRAQRLYPRMGERPPEFRINPAWPLWSDLVYAYCGTRPFGYSSGHRVIAPYAVLGNYDIVWSRELQRPTLYIPSGTASYISLEPSIPDMTEFTIVSWVKLLGTRGQGAILGRWRSDTGWAWFARLLPSGTTQYGMETPNDVIYPGTVTLSTGLWSHIACVFGPTVLLYYNGALDATHTRQQPCDNSGTYLTLTSLRPFENWTSTYGEFVDILLLTGTHAELAQELANPSNVDLRINGTPLILPPRRRLWPVAPVAEYVKRRQLGLRVGSREAVT